MGIFDKLLGGSGGGGSSELDHCPYCGDSLTGFGCVSCNIEFVYEDGKLIERRLSSRGERAERRCISCDTPMKGGGEFTAAWEDGDNADAYVRCPSCGYENSESDERGAPGRSLMPLVLGGPVPAGFSLLCHLEELGRAEGPTE